MLTRLLVHNAENVRIRDSGTVKVPMLAFDLLASPTHSQSHLRHTYLE